MPRYDRNELHDWKGYGYRWENADSCYRRKIKQDKGILSSLTMGLLFAGVVYLIFFL